MKGLSAGLTFFCCSVVASVLLGLMARGLGWTTAWVSLIIGLIAALIAYFGTFDPELSLVRTRPRWRYHSIGFWLIAGCFTLFAVRSFCWLLYIDGAEFRIQSVNNLGDLALHVTYIKTFANGVPLWPDNPIYPFSHLRYPAGVDLFNGLLTLVHVDLIHGLVWVGLAASVATFYAFYRWGGLFGVAGFLFNGGVVGFQFLNNFEFRDYQGQNTIAWKSIPLSMFVTQRGLLYAIPAGVLLLWHWRQKFYGDVAGDDVAGGVDPGRVQETQGNRGQRPLRQGPLPFWVELALYCSMPLFHVHTFLALSAVAASLFVFGNARMRWHLGVLVAAALIPATFFVWLITDHFGAGSMLKWQPGWVQNIGDFKMPFFQFWGVNFGFWFPLLLWFIGAALWQAWQNRERLTLKLPEDLAFLCPAILLFVIGLLVKTAPWEWDNLKLMFWGYFIVLPFLWRGLISQWVLPLRIVMYIALFGSGFVSLFGGLGLPGYGFANRAELAQVGVAVRNLPLDARFATYPTFNHPVLLQGRKVVLGYPGHLWTQGFDHYGEEEAKLGRLMRGEPDWRQQAKALGVRYIFWGREEQLNYPNSTRPWESVLPKAAAPGPWGTIYDLGTNMAPGR
jgi:hypothetical protein